MPEALAYFQGKIVPLSEAKVSVTTHALHYGTAVFEGIRGNWNEGKEKMYVFRMREHYERFIQGCRIMMLLSSFKAAVTAKTYTYARWPTRAKSASQTSSSMSWPATSR